MTTETTNIFGIRAIIEAIESGSSINKVYLQKGLRGNLFLRMVGERGLFVLNSKLLKILKFFCLKLD